MIVTLVRRTLLVPDLMPQTVKTKEHEFIDSIKGWTRSRFIGDDCAVLPGGMLVTSDTLVEGTHFCLDLISLKDLGWKSMAVNLSDIAAMAGRPRYAIVSLTLPVSFDKSMLRSLYEGMVDCADTYRTQIVGGDLTAGSNLIISITLIGDEHEAGVLLRSGAKPGHVVIATGEFGASSMGLWSLLHNQEGFSYSIDKHCRPSPRLCESWLLNRVINGGDASLMDASDGLADALVQIAKASGVVIEVESSLIHIDSNASKPLPTQHMKPLARALYGGEDYELVGTTDEKTWELLQRQAGNPFYVIGKVYSILEGQSPQAFIISEAGKKEALDLSNSFQHFGSKGK